MSSNDEIKNSGCCIEGDGPAYEACLRQEFFAPPERYQLRVLKEVVRRVEKAVMTCESDYYVRSFSRPPVQPGTRSSLVVLSRVDHTSFALTLFGIPTRGSIIDSECWMAQQRDESGLMKMTSRSGTMSTHMLKVCVL